MVIEDIVILTDVADDHAISLHGTAHQLGKTAGSIGKGAFFTVRAFSGAQRKDVEFRMILPQQMLIRDVLDRNAVSLVTKETELEKALGMLHSSADRPTALSV